MTGTTASRAGKRKRNKEEKEASEEGQAAAEEQVEEVSEGDEEEADAWNKSISDRGLSALTSLTFLNLEGVHLVTDRILAQLHLTARDKMSRNEGARRSSTSSRR